MAMESYLYLYGISFILVCMVACCGAVCAWLVSRKRICLSLACCAFCYLIEAALIFFDEYIDDKPIWSFLTENPPMTHPLIKFVLSIGILASVWGLVLLLGERFSRRRLTVPVSVFAVFEAMSFLLPTGDAQQLAFYGLRTLSIMASIAYLLLASVRADSPALRDYLSSFRTVGAAMMVAMAGVLAQDVLTIGLRMPLIDNASWAQFISGRNLPENVSVLIMSVLIVRYAAETLALRYREPPQVEPRGDQIIDVRFSRFCERHGITVREQDILRGLLAGKTNRQIAGELFITDGTVKAHAHSIYKKCGVSSRTEVQQAFWSE